MALDFPTTPAVNDTVTIDNKTWRYNGKGWKLIPNQLQGIQGVQGLQGIQGPLSNNQGTQGVQGVQGLQGVQGSGAQGLQGNLGSQGLQGTFGPATIPLSNDTSGTGDTILSTDNGKLVVITGGLTISNVLNVGENVVIYNDSASQVAISTLVPQTPGVLLRLSGTTLTGTRYLQQRGLATVICVKSNEYAISGAGVT